MHRIDFFGTDNYFSTEIDGGSLDFIEVERNEDGKVGITFYGQSDISEMETKENETLDTGLVEKLVETMDRIINSKPKKHQNCKTLSCNFKGYQIDCHKDGHETGFVILRRPHLSLLLEVAGNQASMEEFVDALGEATKKPQG